MGIREKVSERLSGIDVAKAKLSELVVDALGLDVEVALVMPVGPWQLVPGGQDENQLSPARLQAVRKFLVERGVEPKRIFVESRIDPKLKEPRLDFQMVGRLRTD